MSPETAILCMAYGSPASEAELEAYFTHIRSGRPPSPAALEELTSRYRAIGGGSPLTAITRDQAAALSRRSGLPAFVGMKHAPPFIADGAREAKAAGVERIIGLPLAPHFANMSLGSYRASLEAVWDGELVFIPGFHDHPAFIRAVQTLIEDALAESQPDRIFFTAHSLPARILHEGDPYKDQLLESCRLVAARLGLKDWEFAFQSASHTGEPWLGPDLLEAVERSGARDVLVCPIGFVADHLEILYDLDVEAQGFAREKGIRIRRTRSFNADPVFIDALAQVVADALVRVG
ncbi:MAG TPA: ferrochelatase [Candidatus Dormibacteraeota bacterium]|nr:ferrochelatase [Candidatus Dormibacteraeota bacterium]